MLHFSNKCVHNSVYSVHGSTFTLASTLLYGPYCMHVEIIYHFQCTVLYYYCFSNADVHSNLLRSRSQQSANIWNLVLSF